LLHNLDVDVPDVNATFQATRNRNLPKDCCPSWIHSPR
jgi:hypothetical protein